MTLFHEDDAISFLDVHLLHESCKPLCEGHAIVRDALGFERLVARATGVEGDGVSPVYVDGLLEDGVCSTDAEEGVTQKVHGAP